MCAIGVRLSLLTVEAAGPPVAAAAPPLDKSLYHPRCLTPGDPMPRVLEPVPDMLFGAWTVRLPEFWGNGLESPRCRGKPFNFRRHQLKRKSPRRYKLGFEWPRDRRP